MTLLDKAKSFLGGHGVTVRHVAIEDRDPGTAQLALSDGGVKGTFAVAADKPCTVRGRRTQLVMELAHAEGRTEQVVLGGDEATAAEPAADPGAGAAPGATVRYPYDLAAGAEIIDRFDIVFDGSIEAILALRRLSAGDGVRLFLRTSVNVQGSPFDPEAIDEVTLAP